MPSIDDVLLFEVFHKYCTFGTRTGSLAAAESSAAGATVAAVTTPSLDGTKWAKLVRESSLLDDVITSTEADILFSRVREKGERRISFLQFRLALKLLAEKKYGADTEEAEELVLSAVRNVKGPQLTGITFPEASDTLDRLMEGPPTYISRSPNTEVRPWKEDLRRNSSPPTTPASNRRHSLATSSTSVATPGSSRKSSLNPAQLASQQQQRQQQHKEQGNPSRSPNLAL